MIPRCHHWWLAAGLALGLILGTFAGRAWAIASEHNTPVRRVEPGLISPPAISPGSLLIEELFAQWRLDEAARIADERSAEEARLWARWGPVHQCEQPDSWTIDGTFGNGLQGGGGLGISNGAWNSGGGQGYAPLPGLASPFDQMRVAERILGMYGSGAWGWPVW